MSSMFETAAAVSLWPSMAAAFGQLGTYARGEDEAALTVILVDPLFVETVDGAAAIKVNQQDFLILADDLEIDGSAATPARGDTLAVTLNGAETTFEILSSDFGDFKYEDPARTIFRVSGKEI